MAYQKRKSAVLDKAQTRLRGLQSVNPTLNLGNGLTLRDYATLIETSNDRLQTHNTALAEADRTRIEFAETEASVSALSSRILSAVAAMYGKDSKEYEMAGGKPLSGYKRTRKQVAAPGGSDAQTLFNGSAVNGNAVNGSVVNGAQLTV